MPFSHSTIRQTIRIAAPASKVWNFLTNPELIRLWISDLEVEVVSEWKAGSKILFRGTHDGKPYEDDGIILQFKPNEVFEYSYLSSFSNLPADAENYAVIGFRLTAVEDQTDLVVTVSNCVTDAIYQHHRFYWLATPGVLKKTIERL